jgi:hypothetical protein
VQQSDAYRREMCAPLQVSLPWLSQRGVNFGVRPHVKVNMFLPEVTGCATGISSNA